MQVMIPVFIAQYSTYGEVYRAYINATTGPQTITCMQILWLYCARFASTGAGFSLQQTIFPAPYWAQLRERLYFLLPVAPYLSRLLFYPPAFVLSVVSFFALHIVHK